MTATTSIVCKSCGCESVSSIHCDICGSAFVPYTLEVAVSMMAEVIPVKKTEEKFSRHLGSSECTETQYDIYRTLYYGDSWYITEAKMIGRKLWVKLEHRNNDGTYAVDKVAYGTIGVRGKIAMKGDGRAYYRDITSIEELNYFAARV